MMVIFLVMESRWHEDGIAYADASTFHESDIPAIELPCDPNVRNGYWVEVK